MHPSAVVRPVSQPTIPRTVYVTVSCPGCGRVVEWLGVVEEPGGGTRYAPGECLCGPMVVAA